MTRRLRFGVLGAATAALLALTFAPTEAFAQSARFRVMVTNLSPADGANDDFGKDLAKELRKLINELPTHQPVDEDEIKDGAKDNGLKMEELNCIRSQQLASLINAELVMCGDYTEDKQAKTFSLAGVQFAAPGGPSFAIEDKTWGEKQPKEAALEIFQSFETYIDQLRVASFCGDYFESKQWEQAEEQCSRAMALNPSDPQVRYIYGHVLMEKEELAPAYEQMTGVIELDPLHEGALQTAGYLAIQLDMREEGRKHYDTYLQLNPGNAGVRMQIAYDMGQAGDAEGATLLIEDGLDLEGDNTDLLMMHARLAMSAAAQKRQEIPDTEAGISPEATALYEKALGSYGGAYEIRGAEMEAADLRNMVAAYNELGQITEAMTLAEQAVQTHSEEAGLWSSYADVLKKSDRLDDAIVALDRVREIDPAYPNTAARQGNWLLEAEREDEALAYLQTAVENGEQSADAMARLLFAAGHRKGIAPPADQRDYSYAVRMIEMGKTFEISEGQAGELDFWHAYALYSHGIQQEEPQTLQSAQTTLPKFQTANRLFNLARVAGYAETQPSINIQQFRDATLQYMEIQEAIIARGSR
ncbi:MAG: tetratricopeptide repeat protein [Longimicrobiales bacterium]